MNTSIIASLPPAVAATCALHDAWADVYVASLKLPPDQSRAERRARACPPFAAWCAQNGITPPAAPVVPPDKLLGVDARGVPLLPACWADDGRTLVVFCHRCNCAHRHGVGSGLRAAHCDRDDGGPEPHGYSL